MPKFDDTKEEKMEQKHIHNWIFAGYDQDRCNCGALCVSESELARRDEEWRAFDAMVRETESYTDWKLMQLAFFGEVKDMHTIREITKRAEKRIEEDNYMPHPRFPDPATFNYVIKETL